MQKLIQGIHQFQLNVFAGKRRLFEGLIEGQRPLALFITCADSRINPNLITQTEPGELFILRNAGNIVPSYGAVIGGEAGTIEYAVSVLNVRDIVVCGHSHCGAMAALLAGNSAGLPAVQAWLSNAEATRRIVNENYADVTDEAARLTIAVEENVLVQVENLRTHPAVAAPLSRGELRLHAWVYKFETGQVFTYDPDRQQYVSLESETTDGPEHVAVEDAAAPSGRFPKSPRGRGRVINPTCGTVLPSNTPRKAIDQTGRSQRYA